MGFGKKIIPLAALAGGAVLLGGVATLIIASRCRKRGVPRRNEEEQRASEPKSSESKNAGPVPAPAMPEEPTGGDVPLVFERAAFLDSDDWLTEAEGGEKAIKNVCTALAAAEKVVVTALCTLDKLGSRAPLATEAAVQRLTVRTCLNCDAHSEKRILAVFSAFFGDGPIADRGDLLSNNFAAFLVGDGLLRCGKHKALAAQLIGLSLTQVITVGDYTQHDGGRFSSLPRCGVAPFYFPMALLDLAALMEEGFTIGLPAEYTETEVNASIMPILRVLELTRGDNQKGWQALGSSIGRHGVEVLGRSVQASGAFAEAIRCAGGIDGCRDAQMWLDLALCLQYDPRLEEQTSTALIPHSGHHPFSLATQTANQDRVDKKFCLIRSLTEDMEDATAWLELSNCVAIGNVVEHVHDPQTGTQQPRQVHREERVRVGAMTYGRMDCLSLALALEPDSAEAWYRAALCMEDKLKCQAAALGGVVAERDVYERQILHGVFFDRLTCLIRAVQCDATEGKYWFALGTTVAEREEILASASSPLRGISAEVLTFPSSLLAAGLGRSVEEGTGKELLTSDKCFAAAVVANPQFARLINQWRERRRV